MKLFPLLAVCLSLPTAALASPPADDGNTRHPAAAPGKPWSVVGIWDCTNQYWSGALTLQADGTLIGLNEQTSGRWMLGVQGGQIVLSLYWNGYPTELVSMITADEFRGSPERHDLRMRRRLPPSPPPPGGPGSVETRTWSQGDPPVKLIRQGEGFCALTKVTGHFQGDGESVHVHVADDGYWYLDGTSQQQDVGAECIVVRYRK